MLTSFQENASRVNCSQTECTSWARFKAWIIPGQGEDQEHEHSQMDTVFQRGLLSVWGVWVNSCRRKSYSTEMSVWGGFLPAPSSRLMGELGFIQPDPGPPGCVGSLDDQQEDESSLCQTAVQDEWAGLSSGYVCLLLSLRRCLIFRWPKSRKNPH